MEIVELLTLHLPAATGICFFGIYWNVLINPYTFVNKFRTILRMKAKIQVWVRAKGQHWTEGTRKS